MFASKVTSRMSAFPFRAQFQTGISRLLASKYSTEVSASADQTKNDKASQFVLDKLYKKIEIEVRGNDPAVLKSYGEFATMAAKHLGITMTKNVAPRKAVHERFTLLKSVHIYKKHRVQYEIRTYYRFMDFLKLTGSTADTFMEYLQRNLPEGVAMKVTKVELQKLPESVPQATT